MISISLCMIVKNEEAVLERCLSSVKEAVDEIIVVDTGSGDRTKTIAEQHGAHVYDFEWIDDFAAARNTAFAKATSTYILWLDADDVLEADDLAKLQSLKRTLDPSVDSVTMRYDLSHDEFGNVTFSLRRNRLVKRSRGFRWIGAVHEYLEVGGHIINSDIAVKHRSAGKEKDPGRNLKIYERRLVKGDALTPRDQYYYANELKDHGRHSEAISYYDRFIGGGAGWIEDVISACGKLADCYHALGDRQAELEASLRALQYGAPRAEFCCRIGYAFMQRKDYEAASVWYRLATTLVPPAEHLGFHNPACHTWLPRLQLAVCLDRLGRIAEASVWNEQALSYRPEDAAMLGNRTYFLKRLQEEEAAAASGGQS
ncbi:glycosyltransferase [Paenibacillus sp. IB182496]|uniref:Glycosyltransferase n=1 Tax=Paenibacillus sabuli TaxID=2772509 RepID=A0A927BVJ8_9BACL|nr:glycosyltransferase [Paenibacillus sabuli]MBD2847632.1 glycosyltransferase [Paenibacillus sabuli]